MAGWGPGSGGGGGGGGVGARRRDGHCLVDGSGGPASRARCHQIVVHVRCRSYLSQNLLGYVIFLGSAGGGSPRRRAGASAAAAALSAPSPPCAHRCGADACPTPMPLCRGSQCLSCRTSGAVDARYAPAWRRMAAQIKARRAAAAQGIQDSVRTALKMHQSTCIHEGGSRDQSGA